VKFSEINQDQVVYVNIYDEWREAKVNTLIGDREPNPGRELVELTSPWFECGWEIFDAEDIYPVASFEELATERQMSYLKDLGYDGSSNITKSQASTKIDSLKEWKNAVGACHYCGSPAYGFAFFDEPACSQCGGK
jgi:hypothetical protein